MLILGIISTRQNSFRMLFAVNKIAALGLGGWLNSLMHASSFRLGGDEQ